MELIRPCGILADFAFRFFAYCIPRLAIDHSTCVHIFSTPTLLILYARRRQARLFIYWIQFTNNSVKMYRHKYKLFCHIVSCAVNR